MSSKLYACIISENARADRQALGGVAREFSYGIEMLDDGVLFNVSGLEKLIGKPSQIAQKILASLKKQNIPGNIAVAETVDTALLLARQRKGLDHSIAAPDEFQKLPLENLGIENDSIGIFRELGINSIEDLRQIPVDDLIDRYGREFQKVIDTIEQRSVSFITPNIKENNVAWKFDLDFPVDDFEQLIFIVNHGLDALFRQVEHLGFSTEQLDIAFKLANKTTRSYEIKTSFPTLDKAFWLKLINLRISLDAPEAAILSVDVISHFTKPRASQRGLYTVSRPEPESLLLTVGKLKKLVGEENVGLPVLLNQRLAEAFTLDADVMPDVNSSDREVAKPQDKPVIAFTWYRPPRRAEVLVRDRQLVFIRTRNFSGHVTACSGVWKASSTWWNRTWKTQEWDVDVENAGIYRLCKAGDEWLVTGEYD